MEGSNQQRYYIGGTEFITDYTPGVLRDPIVSSIWKLVRSIPKCQKSTLHASVLRSFITSRRLPVESSIIALHCFCTIPNSTKSRRQLVNGNEAKDSKSFIKCRVFQRCIIFDSVPESTSITPKSLRMDYNPLQDHLYHAARGPWEMSRPCW